MQKYRSGSNMLCCAVWEVHWMRSSACQECVGYTISTILCLNKWNYYRSTPLRSKVTDHASQKYHKWARLRHEQHGQRDQVYSGWRQSQTLRRNLVVPAVARCKAKPWGTQTLSKTTVYTLELRGWHLQIIRSIYNKKTHWTWRIHAYHTKPRRTYPSCKTI